MSFGWSAGDILTGVRTLWTVYECFGDGVRNAHKEFKNFQDEVQSFLDLLKASQMLVEGIVDLNPLFKKTTVDCETFIHKHRLLATEWSTLLKNGSGQKTDAFVKVYKTVMWPAERAEIERLQNQWLRHIVFGNFVASSHTLNISQRVDKRLGEVDQKADQISVLLQKVLQHFEHYTRLAIRPENIDDPLPALETLRSLEETPARNISSVRLLHAPNEDRMENFTNYLETLAARCENRATRDHMLVNVDRTRSPDNSLLQVATERQTNILKRGQKAHQSILEDQLPSFLGVSPVIIPNPIWQRHQQGPFSPGVSRINTLASDEDDSFETAIRRLSTNSFTTTGTARTGSSYNSSGTHDGTETPLTESTPDSMTKIAVFNYVQVSCKDVSYTCTVTLYRDTLNRADSYLESQTLDERVRILHHLPVRCYPWLYPARMKHKKNCIHFRGKHRAARSVGSVQDYKSISPPEYTLRDSQVLKSFQVEILQQRIHLNVDITSINSKSNSKGTIQESKLEVLRLLEDKHTTIRSLFYCANGSSHQERSFELGIFDKKPVLSGDRVVILNVTNSLKSTGSFSIRRRSSTFTAPASAIEDPLPHTSELQHLEIKFTEERGRDDFVKMYGKAWQIGSSSPSPQASPSIGPGPFDGQWLSTSPRAA